MKSLEWKQNKKNKNNKALEFHFMAQVGKDFLKSANHVKKKGRERGGRRNKKWRGVTETLQETQRKPMEWKDRCVTGGLHFTLNFRKLSKSSNALKSWLFHQRSLLFKLSIYNHHDGKHNQMRKCHQSVFLCRDHRPHPTQADSGQWGAQACSPFQGAAKRK